MKIALLHLPIDDNYSGNLLRFALINVLQNLGYGVIYLFVICKTFRMDGDIFCYILDLAKEKMECIDNIAKERKMKPFVTGLYNLSIEQWFRDFADAKYIITDFYHGLVFSMIFNKLVKLFFSDFGGNARFKSLFKLFGISNNQEEFDWNRINGIMGTERPKAISQA